MSHYQASAPPSIGIGVRNRRDDSSSSSGSYHSEDDSGSGSMSSGDTPDSESRSSNNSSSSKISDSEDESSKSVDSSGSDDDSKGSDASSKSVDDDDDNSDSAGSSSKGSDDSNSSRSNTGSSEDRIRSGGSSDDDSSANISSDDNQSSSGGGGENSDWSDINNSDNSNSSSGVGGGDSDSSDDNSDSAGSSSKGSDDSNSSRSNDSDNSNSSSADASSNHSDWSDIPSSGGSGSNDKDSTNSSGVRSDTNSGKYSHSSNSNDSDECVKSDTNISNNSDDSNDSDDRSSSGVRSDTNSSSKDSDDNASSNHMDRGRARRGSVDGDISRISKESGGGWSTGDDNSSVSSDVSSGNERRMTKGDVKNHEIPDAKDSSSSSSSRSGESSSSEQRQDVTNSSNSDRSNSDPSGGNDESGSSEDTDENEMLLTNEMFPIEEGSSRTASQHSSTLEKTVPKKEPETHSGDSDSKEASEGEASDIYSSGEGDSARGSNSESIGSGSINSEGSSNQAGEDEASSDDNDESEEEDSEQSLEEEVSEEDIAAALSKSGLDSTEGVIFEVSDDGELVARLEHDEQEEESSEGEDSFQEEEPGSSSNGDVALEEEELGAQQQEATEEANEGVESFMFMDDDDEPEEEEEPAADDTAEEVIGVENLMFMVDDDEPVVNDISHQETMCKASEPMSQIVPEAKAVMAVSPSADQDSDSGADSSSTYSSAGAGSGSESDSGDESSKSEGSAVPDGSARPEFGSNEPGIHQADATGLSGEVERSENEGSRGIDSSKNHVNAQAATEKADGAKNFMFINDEEATTGDGNLQESKVSVSEAPKLKKDDSQLRTIGTGVGVERSQREGNRNADMNKNDVDARVATAEAIPASQKERKVEATVTVSPSADNDSDADSSSTYSSAGAGNGSASLSGDERTPELQQEGAEQVSSHNDKVQEEAKRADSFMCTDKDFRNLEGSMANAKSEAEMSKDELMFGNSVEKEKTSMESNSLPNKGVIGRSHEKQGPDFSSQESKANKQIGETEKLAPMVDDNIRMSNQNTTAVVMPSAFEDDQPSDQFTKDDLADSSPTQQNGLEKVPPQESEQASQTLAATAVSPSADTVPGSDSSSTYSSAGASNGSGDTSSTYSSAGAGSGGKSESEGEPKEEAIEASGATSTAIPVSMTDEGTPSLQYEFRESERLPPSTIAIGRQQPAHPEVSASSSRSGEYTRSRIMGEESEPGRISRRLGASSQVLGEESQPGRIHRVSRVMVRPEGSQVSEDQRPGGGADNLMGQIASEERPVVETVVQEQIVQVEEGRQSHSVEKPSEDEQLSERVFRHLGAGFATSTPKKQEPASAAVNDHDMYFANNVVNSPVITPSFDGTADTGDIPWELPRSTIAEDPGDIPWDPVDVGDIPWEKPVAAQAGTSAQRVAPQGPPEKAAEIAIRSQDPTDSNSGERDGAQDRLLAEEAENAKRSEGPPNDEELSGIMPVDPPTLEEENYEDIAALIMAAAAGAELAAVASVDEADADDSTESSPEELEDDSSDDESNEMSTQESECPPVPEGFASAYKAAVDDSESDHEVTRDTERLTAGAKSDDDVDDGVSESDVSSESDYDLERGRDNAKLVTGPKSDDLGDGGKGKKRRRICVIAIVLLAILVILLAVLLPLLLGRDSSERDVSTQHPSPSQASPAPAPITPPTAPTRVPDIVPTRPPAETMPPDSRLRYDVSGGPFDGPSNSRFGISVSIDGSLGIVGAPLDKDRGSVAVYLNSDTNGWSSNQVLTGEQVDGYFGFSVAVTITGMLVGAPGVYAPDSELASGAAYFYQYNRLDGIWSPLGSEIRGQRDLQAVNEDFGVSVAASRMLRVVIGAPGRNSATGGVYIYQFRQVAAGSSDSDWLAMTELPLSGETSGGGFGASVDISQDGSRAIGGAPGNGAGYVHIFSWTTANEWLLEHRIEGIEEEEEFGSTVRFLSGSGDSFLVGSPGYRNVRGAVRVYNLQGGQVKQLGPDIIGNEGEYIGASGTASGLSTEKATYILAATDTGVVKRFDYDIESDSWIQKYAPVQTEFSNGVSSLSHFGTNFFMVGGAGDDQSVIYETASLPPTPPPGSDSPGGGPTTTAPAPSTPTLPPSNGNVPSAPVTTPTQPPGPIAWEIDGGPFTGEEGFNLGISVSITESYMVAGATNGNGLVNTYRKVNNAWSPLTTITGNEKDSLFGFSANMNPSDSLVVGAPRSVGVGTTTVTGAAYVYQLDASSSSWVQRGSEIRGDEDIFAAGELFGYSVAISPFNDIVACGAPVSNERNIIEAGRVYTFRWNTEINRWTPRQATSLSDTEAGSNLGYAVDLSSDGSIMIAGGPGRNTDSGYAIIYEWGGLRWGVLSSLDAETEGEQFGSSAKVLSQDGYVVAIGGPNYDNGRGVIRVYRRDQGSVYNKLGTDIVGEPGDALGSQNSLDGSETPGTNQSVVVLASTAGGLVRRYEYNRQMNTWEESVPAVYTGLASPAIGGTTDTKQVVVGGSNKVAVLALK